MAQKRSSFELLIDARPDVASGVYAAMNDIKLYATFDEAIGSGAIQPIGEQTIKSLAGQINQGFKGGKPLERLGDQTFDGLIGLHTKDVVTTTRFNHLMGLVDESYLSAVTISNKKSLFFELLKSSGVRLPFIESTSNGVFGAVEIIAKSGVNSLIVKPSSGTGSVDVVRVSAKNESSLEAELLTTFGSDDRLELTVMEEITNSKAVKEYAVNFIVVDRAVAFIATLAKVEQSSEGRFRDELIATCDLDDIQISIRDDLVRRIADSLGCEFGVFQLEVRVNNDGEWIPIDISMRPDGGLVPEITLATTGVDLRLAQAYAQIGRPDLLKAHVFSPNETASASAAIGAFYSRSLTHTSWDKMMVATEERRVAGVDLFRAVFGVDFSNLAVQKTEIRAALCALGLTHEHAISSLKRAASELGLESASQVSR